MPFNREAVRTLREEVGGQAKLAAKLREHAIIQGYTHQDYDQSTISRWERGPVKPGPDALDMLYLVAEELKLDLEFYEKPKSFVENYQI